MLECDPSASGHRDERLVLGARVRVPVASHRADQAVLLGVLRGDELHRSRVVAARAQQQHAHRIREMSRGLAPQVRCSPHRAKGTGLALRGELAPPACELRLAARCHRDQFGTGIHAERDRVAGRRVTGVQREYAMHATRVDGLERGCAEGHDLGEPGELRAATTLVDHGRVAIDSQHLEPMTSGACEPCEQQGEVRAPASRIEQLDHGVPGPELRHGGPHRARDVIDLEELPHARRRHGRVAIEDAQGAQQLRCLGRQDLEGLATRELGRPLGRPVGVCAFREGGRP
ncbi:hypothetical protein BH11MYX1_BH11MYX1_21490 [soil metagenome]